MRGSGHGEVGRAALPACTARGPRKPDEGAGRLGGAGYRAGPRPSCAVGCSSLHLTVPSPPLRVKEFVAVF